MSNKIKVDLTDTIKGYIVASKKYQIHKNKLSDQDLKSIYLKKVSEYYDRHFKNIDFKIKLLECLETDILPQVEIEKDLVLKQALMEINNALSHLNSTIHGINETEDNIDKAKVHIQRATLDCYKAIIKNLTFLNKIEDNFTEKLKRLRYLEYSKIGSKSLSRSEVIREYETFIEENTKL